MREIKFRAWDKENNKFLDLEWEDYYIDMSTGEVYEIEERSKNYMTYMHKRYLGNVILMQFTGLKDKNGVEIYEGDILDCANHWRRTVIEWYNAGFRGKYYDYNDEVSYAMIASAPPEGIEVIGNIYANPELLKEE